MTHILRHSLLCLFLAGFYCCGGASGVTFSSNGTEGDGGGDSSGGADEIAYTTDGDTDNLPEIEEVSSLELRINCTDLDSADAADTVTVTCGDSTEVYYCSGGVLTREDGDEALFEVTDVSCDGDTEEISEEETTVS